jgi:putative membrane protein
MSKNDGLNPSIVKGALAGLIGGLAGAAAKSAAEKVFPPRVNGQTSPLQLVQRVDAETHREMSYPQEPVAADAIHWSFGGLAGATYGVLVELSPATAAWRGAAFGLAVNRLTHEGALPLVGLSAPVERPTPQQRYSDRATHVVYGVVTELVRRAVRRIL